MSLEKSHFYKYGPKKDASKKKSTGTSLKLGHRRTFIYKQNSKKNYQLIASQSKI